MGIQKAYNDWSSSYDSDENRTRDLDEQLIREALENLRFTSILEIGCGTGKNTGFLAQIGQRVRGLDFSEGMLERARQKVRAENVRFSRADLTQKWPCEAGGFDLVICNLVLEHIQDLSFIFSEVSRVLAPGGQFLLNELHPFRQYEGTKARYQSDQGVVEVQAFTHHISDFLKAAADSGLKLVRFDERWHAQDSHARPPRIVSFVFQK